MGVSVNPTRTHSITAEDRRANRFNAIDERIRGSRDEIGQIDEAISEDLSDYAAIVTALANASETGLIQLLAEGRPLPWLSAGCRDAFAALARIADELALARETRTQSKIEEEFDSSERDTEEADPE